MLDLLLTSQKQFKEETINIQSNSLNLFLKEFLKEELWHNLLTEFYYHSATLTIRFWLLIAQKPYKGTFERVVKSLNQDEVGHIIQYFIFWLEVEVQKKSLFDRVHAAKLIDTVRQK